MPLDISNLVIKANLMSGVHSDDKDIGQKLEASRAEWVQKTAVMFQEFLPTVRLDLHDRLNR